VSKLPKKYRNSLKFTKGKIAHLRRNERNPRVKNFLNIIERSR